MSEDKDSKTEEPTQRRLEQAHEKGQVASSREISHWLVLAAGCAAVSIILPNMAHNLLNILRPFLENPEDIPVGKVELRALMARLLGLTAQGMALFAISQFVVGLMSQYLQHGSVFSAEPLMPKWEKISLVKGFARLFSGKAILEFGKGLFKIILVTVVAVWLLRPVLEEMPLYVRMSPSATLEATKHLIVKLFGGVLAVLFVLAAVDMVYQKFSFRQGLRMSKQELKEEFKQTEGDPHIKGKLKQLRAEKSRKRAMARVPEASVIITNPTHYAVALKYEQGQQGAPIVLAKGVDHLAAKIRSIAGEHKIPIISNPPLARALYASVKEEEEIPIEHYKAVADIISYILKMKKRR